MITKKKMCMTIVVILAVNILVIAGILYYNNMRMKQAYAVAQAEKEEMYMDNLMTDLEEVANEYGDGMIDAEDDGIDNLDVLRNAPSAESYNNVYSSLLIGDYVAEDGTAFRFSPGNSYSGYFNEDAPDVVNYSYEIVNISDTENEIVIYSADKRSEVKYSLDLDMEGNVILTIPDTETKYTLCYDGMAYKGDKPVKVDEEKKSDESDAESTDNE